MHFATWASRPRFQFFGGGTRAGRRDDGARGAGVSGTNDLETALASVCQAVGVELVDLELVGSTLQVTVERNEGLDLDRVADVNRMVSAFLDEHDDLAPAGRYELEVGTPGLERRLRRPEHFRRALATTVSIRTVPGTEGERRIEGVLESVDDEGFDLLTADGASRRIAFDEVERARTVFDWQAALRGPSIADSSGIDDERAENMTEPREARR